MKKIVFLVVVLCCCTGGVFSQITVDPSHEIYTDLRAWESLGLVRNLPHVRPYPMQLLIPTLQEVVEKGNQTQSKRAQHYLLELTGSPIHVEAEGEGSIRYNRTDSVSNESLVGSGGIVGDFSFLNIASMGYDLKITGYKNEPLTPHLQSSLYDISNDPADIGPIEAFLNMNALTTVGTENLYIQGGISRSSFGSFYENNSVINNQAFHTGNFTGVIRQDKWTYTQSFYVLGASDNTGENIRPNKYMALHAVSVYPLPWLTLSYFENIVYGDRFDPAYLLPVVPYMVVQSLGSYSDNLQMGLGIDFTLPHGLKWNNSLLVDDVSVNEFVKLNFDSKLRIVAQTGLAWAPEEEGLAKLVTFDYTLISPFTYTHHHKFFDDQKGTSYLGGVSSINYQNYTTNGMSIGTNLPPNSDRLFLSVILTPIEKLDIKLTANMIRSANVSESLSTESAMQYLALPAGSSFMTDGTVNNHFTAPNGDPLAESKEFGFMKQQTKMYVWQTGIDVSYSLPRYNWGKVTFNVGYTFEYIRNYGVHENIFYGIGAAENFDSTTGAINEEYKKVDGSSISEADVEAALAAWRSNLRDLIHHYIRASVIFNY